MKAQSAKAKGRNLQKFVVEKIYELHPFLEEGDVRSTGMGQGGEDVQLSPAARKVFPYSIECKSRESIAVYAWFQQAKANAPAGVTPLLVIKQNRSEPLIVLRAEDWFKEKLNG